jgi:hypothetical protein
MPVVLVVRRLRPGHLKPLAGPTFYLAGTRRFGVKTSSGSPAYHGFARLPLFARAALFAR